MSKRLILVLAIAFVIGIAFSAYAEVQNVKVSGDVAVSAIGRGNIKLTKSDRNEVTGTPYAGFGEHVQGVLSQVRLRVDADLTDNVSTTVRLINEKLWDTEDADSTDIDLDLAYVTMKEFLYSPLTLTVGRQELHYGNDLIIGDSDTNGLMAGHTTPVFLPKAIDDLSLRKSFDAIKATLNYDPLVVDVAFSILDENSIDAHDNVYLLGANANYALDKATTLETYIWSKKRQKAGSSAVPTNDTVNTFGGRVQNASIKNLVVGLEVAAQLGTKVVNTTLYPDDAGTAGAKSKRRAFALQAVAQYDLSDVSENIKKYQPMLGINYTYLSGESYKHIGKTYRGWDAMFENQTSGKLYNKILGFSNCSVINASLAAKPMEDVKVELVYSNVMLAKEFRKGVDITAVNLSGVAGDPTYAMVAEDGNLGNEIDATLTYDYTEDVQLGLTGGLFMPGKAFDKSNRDTATQVIGSMKVTF